MGREEGKEYIAILAILHEQDVYPPLGAAEGWTLVAPCIPPPARSPTLGSPRLLSPSFPPSPLRPLHTV